MKHNVTKIFALLLTGAMALSIVACGGNEEPADTTTQATTTQVKLPTVDPNASHSQDVKTDYDVSCEAGNISVQKGTSLEDVIANLPTEATVTIPGAGSGTAEALFDETFDSADSVAENWVLCDADSVATIADGKYATTGNSERVKAYVNDPEWAKLNTEEYANYVITAKLTGTADTPDNNFGIIFRASGITETGPDSYTGMYVGIGDSNGQLVIGKAQNNWTSIATVDFDYQPNVEYTLTVVVYNELFAVLLDGEKMYEGEVDPTMVNGTVGLRTYKQLYECSEYSVRTLGADDAQHFENGFSTTAVVNLTWTCSDYDPQKAGRYGFFGTATEGLEEGKQAQVKVIVTVR